VTTPTGERFGTPPAIIVATVVAWLLTPYPALATYAAVTGYDMGNPLLLVVGAGWTLMALIAAVGLPRRWETSRVCGIVIGTIVFIAGVGAVVQGSSSVALLIGGSAVLVGFLMLAAGATLVGLMIISKSARAWFAGQ
jgi:hypothetical protein